MVIAHRLTIINAGRDHRARSRLVVKRGHHADLLAMNGALMPRECGAAEAAAEAERKVESRFALRSEGHLRRRLVLRAPPVPGGPCCRRSIFVSLAFGRFGTSTPLVPLALERQGVDKFMIGIGAASAGNNEVTTLPAPRLIKKRLGAVPLIADRRSSVRHCQQRLRSHRMVCAAVVRAHLLYMVGGVPWSSEI